MKKIFPPSELAFKELTFTTKFQLHEWQSYRRIVDLCEFNNALSKTTKKVEHGYIHVVPIEISHIQEKRFYVNEFPCVYEN